MNKGTAAGDTAEILAIQFMNENKELYSHYFSIFDENFSNLFVARVTTKQFSKLSNQKVMTRADAYCIYTNDEELIKYIFKNNFYISEDILINSNYNYNQINFSGISIKIDDSNSNTLLKLTPNSFNELFQNFELGAGASLFCLKDNEIHKNDLLLQGWNTTPEKMSIFFKKPLNSSYTLSKDFCKEIKNIANSIICDKINSSTLLQEKIFNGIHLYDEPYTAYFYFQNTILSKLKTLPYTVTTGSGRSKQDYTLVLKPKK